MAEQKVGTTENSDELPTIVVTPTTSDRQFEHHREDQIRMFQEGMLAAISQSLKETASGAQEAGTTALNAIQGDQAARDRMIKSAENVYAALSNPETYKKMVEALGEKAGVLQMAVEKGDNYGAGMIVGAAAVEVVGPGKGKALEKAAELGADAAKLTDHAADVTRHMPDKVHEGEFLPKDEAGKGVAVHTAPADVNSLMQRVTEQAKGLVQTAKDAINLRPASEQVMLEAHRERLTTLQIMDEKHKVGGDVDYLLAAQEQRYARAEAMSERLKMHPDAKDAKITPEMAKAMINDPRYDDSLGVKPLPEKALPKPEVLGQMEAEQKRLAEAKAALQAEMDLRAEMPAWQRIPRAIWMDSVHGPGVFTRYGETEWTRMQMAAAETESERLKIMAMDQAKRAATFATTATLVGGGSYLYATSGNDKAEMNRQSSLTQNERLADTFGSSAGTAKKEEEALKVHPELKPMYDAYHQAVDAAQKSHPGTGGQTSSEASSEIFRTKQNLIESIKNGALDQRSSADSLTPEQKVLAASQFIQTLPEHQRGAYQEKVAEYANKSGVKIEETQTQTLQQEHEVQRT